MRVCTVDSIQGTLACHPLFFLTPIPLTPPAFQRKSPSHFSLYLLGCLETPVAHQHPAPSDTSLMKKTPCTPSLPLATDLLTMTTPPNVYLSKINPHQVSLTTPMRHDRSNHSLNYFERMFCLCSSPYPSSSKNFPETLERGWQ